MVFRGFTLLYIISLFYNIPIANIGQEIKLYDPVFVYFFIQYIRNREGVLAFARADAASRGMVNFSLWCSLTFLVTCVWMVGIGQIGWIFQSGLYLLHLWGFVICTIFMRKDFLMNRAYFENTIFAFLIIGIAACVIIVGQNLGAIPYLWPSVYFIGYGDNALTGTLGPNRVVPGTTMFLLFVVSVAVVAAKQSLKKSRPAAIVLAVLSLVVALLAGSRTGYITIAGFLVVLTILSPVNVLKFAIPGVLLVVIVGALANTGALSERISFMLDYRVFDDVSDNQKYADQTDYYDKLGSGRKGKFFKAGEFILENPWIIPVGAGFNNRFSGATREGNSAHNLYLTLVIENGLVGLILYFWMIVGFMRGRFWDRQTFILMAAVCGVLINMFFGENFYIYRPCFALLGLLFLSLSIVDIKRLEVAFLNKKQD